MVQIAPACPVPLAYAKLDDHVELNRQRRELFHPHPSRFHITRRRGCFGARNHAMPSWSGVYCVRHDGDDTASDSGRLTPINPNSAATVYLGTDLANIEPPCAMRPCMLRPEPGQPGILPSRVRHEVPPCEGERITMAFNAGCMLDGAQPADMPLG